MHEATGLRSGGGGGGLVVSERGSGLGRRTARAGVAGGGASWSRADAMRALRTQRGAAGRRGTKSDVMRSAMRSALLRTHWMAGREVCVASRWRSVLATLLHGHRIDLAGSKGQMAEFAKPGLFAHIVHFAPCFARSESFPLRDRNPGRRARVQERRLTLPRGSL
jgi:hypothetical protein